MTRFLIDENVNQRAIRMVPIQGKNFDILFPEQGSYKGAVDTAIVKRAIADSRVLVSQEKDFGKFQLEPDFRHKIIEVFPEQVVIRTSSGTVDNFQIQNLDPGNQ